MAFERKQTLPAVKRRIAKVLLAVTGLEEPNTRNRHRQYRGPLPMLAHRGGRHTARLLDRLEELIANFRRIIAINRNVGFFTTGYNWLIQIIPALIVAPAFIRGEIEFGVITQSAMGWVAAFIPTPVMRGFIEGLA